MNLFSVSILEKFGDIFDSVAALPDDARMETINALRLELHKISPMASEPVDCVLWVKAEDIKANDYNPNSVAPPEMKLLTHSILEDGYTQPIVAWKNGTHYEIVDGYHRNRVGQEVVEVRKRIKGYLPITVVNEDRHDKGDRIAATIRHNRARGKHRIDGMSDIVVELKRRNWSDEKIGKELGMDPDEVLRLTQITGLAEMFADREFSQSWEAEESTEINEEDSLLPHEENLSPLPTVGGLAGGDVPGDTVPDSALSDRCSSTATKDACAPENGDAPSDNGVAHLNSGQPEQHGEEPSGVAGSSGMLFDLDGAGLPYETRMAQHHGKPAGRSKRRSRSNY